MKRILVIILSSLALAGGLRAQEGYVPSPENLAARERFAADRFGVFIHWGLYAQPGQGEWVMQQKNLDYREYARLANSFYPSKFDARAWVKAIKAGGARYITITSRHHDGFSLFRSAASSYNAADGTPFGRDILAELAQACREEGIRLHFYYSHVDWGRTDYWPRGRTGLGTGRPDGKEGDWAHYQAFMKAQLTELLTQYGPVGAIWFDGTWDKDDQPREAQPAIWGLYDQYSLIHRLQPGCLVGNNHHLDPFPGEDIQIFEKDVPGENEAGFSGTAGVSRLPLETCQTMNHSWGYNLTDHSYKSADDLVRYLVRTASKGANLLLNIGPRPDGTLPGEAVARLEAMGKWLEINGESIYGTQAGCIPEQPWGVTTQKGNVLYLHLLNPDAVPASGTLTVELPAVDPTARRARFPKVRGAALLADGTPVAFGQKQGTVTLTIPEPSAKTPDLVIALELR